MKDPALRERIAREMLEQSEEGENMYIAAGSPENILLTSFKTDELKPYAGKTLAEVAKMRGTDPRFTAMDLIVEDDTCVGTVYFTQSEDVVRKAVALPWVSFNSDAASRAPEGVFLKSNPHPRAYGSFARALARLDRQAEQAMKKLFFVIILFTTLVSPTWASTAPATMRVDFFHSGNQATELFSLDQVVIEALPWTGNMAQPIDRTLRGKYLFEITSNGETVWSRSFSSIYGEWETTSEARKINRSFHESVRFPAQSEVFELVLKKRNADNRFEEVWRIELDPNDHLVHRESALYAEQVVAVHEGGDPGVKVDLLLMGDGYTAEEHDAFIAKAKELSNILFATSPFRERKDDFNVWAVAPAAAKSGVSRPSTGTYRDSPIGATYDAFRSERYILTFDNKSMRRIASSAPYDFIEILTNTEVYGGGGIYGLFSTAAANSEWAPYLFVHEFGHHFAGLADEYYTSSVAYEAPAEIKEPYEPNVTALLDPDKLKWKHHVAPNTPIPTPWPKAEYEKHSMAYQERRREMRAANVREAEMNALFRYTKEFVETLFEKSGQNGVVGAFEGGNYQAEGYYRSEQNCLMFTRSEAFCAVCAEAIEKVIDEYTGVE